jgi:hypothetical protein
MTTVGEPAATETPLRPALNGPSSLPAGAATTYVFGSTTVKGIKRSLLPPNTADVNQRLVASARRLGPFDIDPYGHGDDLPNACELTDLAQLKALDHSIFALKGVPNGHTGSNIGSGGITSTPENVDCTFNVETTFDRAGSPYRPRTFVEITYYDIGPGVPREFRSDSASSKAAALKAKDPTQYRNYGNLGNGVSCYGGSYGSFAGLPDVQDEVVLDCLFGDLWFEVAGTKTTGGPLPDVDRDIWIDQIEIPLAEVLGREMRTVDG